jgi:hypothetical protein
MLYYKEVKMILVEMAFCLGLLALIGGACLYLWSVRAEAGPGVGLAKSLGVIVIILSILSILASLFSGVGMRKLYHQIRNNTSQGQSSTSGANSPQENNQTTAPQSNATPPNNTATPTPNTTSSNAASTPSGNS